MRTFPRTCALVAVAAGVNALACSDPEFNTDLDSEGDPEVTMVTVLSESRGESPTFCIQGEGIKVNASLCPETEGSPGVREAAPVMDALPGDDTGAPGWYIRFVFSELLDPDIETLEEVDDDGDGNPDRVVGHIEPSQPFRLTCGGAPVAYDGFYDPSGNDVTFPPGPALVLVPSEYVQSGRTDCQVTLNTNVTDKDGNPVGDSGLMGPHIFGVAPMGLALGATGAPRTTPPNMATGVDPSFMVMGTQQGPKVVFNAPVDAATLAGQISFTGPGGDVAFTAKATGSIVELTLTGGPLAANSTYTVAIPKANAIADIAGGKLGLAEDFTFSFTTK
jgi:hypothetical protein